MTVEAFACRCGTVSGTLRVSRGSGTHVRCHCPLCDRAMRHYGFPANRRDGVDLFQTTPDTIDIARGADRLTPVRVSPGDMIRWVAGCCGTPLFVTPDRAIYAFVGVVLANFADSAAFGPVVAHCYVESPSGRLRHRNAPRLARDSISRGIRALFSGRWRRTPFFDPATGRPIRPARLLPRGAGLPPPGSVDGT